MPTVVKLGGSLIGAGSLQSWLRVLICHGGGRCIIVPGGGDFADAVRQAQRRYSFSDIAAHRMALLAMHQYALLLIDLVPSLRPCESEEEMHAVLRGGGLAVWMPIQMTEADPSIAANWDVTSDSLAAWLTRRVGADRLVLVKSVSSPPPPVLPGRLAALGLVDPAFPIYAAHAPFTLEYCGPGDEERLAVHLISEHP